MGECEKINDAYMRNALILALLVTLLLGGQTPSPIQQMTFQHDLDALTKRGFTYRMLDNDLIEFTDPMSGEKRIKSLREPSEATIRSWAAQRGIPILEIDPNTIDTNKYTGWFTYWGMVPLSNDAGMPLIIDDLNHNGRPEVWGLYRDSGQIASKVYEVDSNGVSSLVHEFVPRMGSAFQITDVDRDSLKEINYTYGDSAYNFEQSSFQDLPTHRQFAFAEYEYSGTGIVTRVGIRNLDKDKSADFLYRGSIRDSMGNPVLGTFVAEFNDSMHNFQKVWTTNLSSFESAIGGYEANDFDADGREDFAASDIFGNVFVVENTGDNAYAIMWRDTVPFSNAFYQGSGDIDNDGRPELFIGASVNGNWTTMFEADSDNSYSPKLLIHLLSGGGFDKPQYLATDVDGDGIPELTICSGADIYMFKSNADNQYSLWYLKRENARDGIQFYDFNKDGRKDFIVSKAVYVDPPGYFRNYADIYVGTSLVSVNEHASQELPERVILYPNYPNPFNPTTSISYDLPASANVSLKVHDLLGREVATLVDGFVEAGHHNETLNAAHLASGVYFFRIRAGGFVQTKKLLLLR